MTTIDKAKDFFEYAVNSRQYTNWKDKAKESYQMYDGQQWTQEEIAVLADRKQPAIVVNKLAPKVDNLAGTEKNNASVITFRPRTIGDNTDRLMAEAFTSIGVNWQETQDSVYKNSGVFSDSLIGGIGWSYLYSKERNPFQHEQIDTFEIVWDVDDRSKDMSNQRFVCRVKWMDIEEVAANFPNKATEVNALANSKKNERMSRTSISGQGESKGLALESYITDNGNQLLVVEVQYRVPTTAYEFTDANGRYKRVFDEKYANKNKKTGTKVQKVVAFKIMYTFYTADILLDSGALEEQDEQFQYIPLLHKRFKITGVPYGIVENGKDIQREINKRRSKTMHLLNTNQVIVEGDNIQDFEAMRAEMAKPDGVLVAPKGSIKLNANLQLAAGQQDMYRQSNQELQDVMGVFDESLGAETNATSGIAIARRDGASNKTNSIAFDQFKLYKKRFGRKIMSMIQNMDSEVLVADISGLQDNPTGEEAILLNQPYKIGRKEVKEYDVKTANFDIHVEENNAYDAPPQEAAQNLRELLNSPQLLPVLAQAPELLTALGIRNAEALSAQLAKGLSTPSPDSQDGTQAGTPQVPQPSQG